MIMLRRASAADAPAYVTTLAMYPVQGLWDTTPYIADDMGISELYTKGGCWIDPGVHACQYQVLLCWGKGKEALGEGRAVLR